MRKWQLGIKRNVKNKKQPKNYGKINTVVFGLFLFG